MPKYAVLDNIDLEKWRGHEEVSMERLAPEGATWDVYGCYRNELPDLDAIDQYTGVFVSGSHCSANDPETWIQQEEAWLQAFAKQHTPCKLFASCFGCQLLAKALGGEVGKNPSGEFVLTVETMTATAALVSQPFFRETAAQHKVAQTIKIIQSHGEQILALPKGAVLLATSPTAPFEAWSFGPNILALQGHCEFDAKTTLDKIHATLTNNGRLTSEQSRASFEALHNISPDDAFVTDVIKRWWSQHCTAPASASEPADSAAAVSAASSASESAASAAAASAAAAGFELAASASADSSAASASESADSASADSASASGEDTSIITSKQHTPPTFECSASHQQPQQSQISVAQQEQHPHQQKGISEAVQPQTQLPSSEEQTPSSMPSLQAEDSQQQVKSRQQTKSQQATADALPGPLQQPQQPFPSLTAGHPQAADIAAITNRLHTDAQSDPQSQQAHLVGHASAAKASEGWQHYSASSEEADHGLDAQRTQHDRDAHDESDTQVATDGQKAHLALDAQDAHHSPNCQDVSAAKQELQGWVDEVLRHEDRLSQKAQVLMTELAAVVAAETANSTADYRLVANMNGLVQKQYAEMLTFVQSLQPQMQDLLVCQEAAQPVLEAIAKLEKNVDVIEDAIAGLESDSKQLMQRLQIS